MRWTNPFEDCCGLLILAAGTESSVFAGWRLLCRSGPSGVGWAADPVALQHGQVDREDRFIGEREIRDGRLLLWKVEACLC